MKTHMRHSASLHNMLMAIIANRELIIQLVKRDVVGRYRGSMMGLAWSFFHPILMLTVYTFVFSVVMKAKWGVQTDGGHVNFAVVLFSGMIVHALFAEVLNRSATVIAHNGNYVKRVIFPLEILPFVTLSSSLFHAVISLCVLFFSIVLLHGTLYWTSVLLPFVLLPLMMFTLGVAWFLSAVGVYLRDVGQVIGVFTTVMLFVSPVFYPLSSIPEKFQPYILLNPLTFMIEQSRAVLLYGQLPDFKSLLIYYLVATAVMWLGYYFFQKLRKGFADVL